MMLPFFLIILLYIWIVVVISQHHLYCKNVLLTSTIVIFSGIVAYYPATITNFLSIPISYEFAQVATVTFYYTSSVVNPLVYFCWNPLAKREMGVMCGRRYARARNNVSPTDTTGL